MGLVVQKFGGTSVGDTDRIKNVALKVKAEVDAGNQVVVVVSAMAGVTNQLVKYCQEITPDYNLEEYDVVVSTGEQVTIGLLAMALQAAGIPARSWTGWQVPVLTDDAASKARINQIDVAGLQACLAAGMVPVVAGFQGINDRGRITTLGRGGSDTSAVGLAAVLKADRCDIYTDVDGVYTTDPRFVKNARKLDQVTYEEMLEMASLGAKVLQTRSVELAMKYRVNLRVVSSFEKNPVGTTICDEGDIVEKEIISGITCSRDEAKITLVGVQDNALVGQAFTAAFGSFGPKFIAISILLFAYSTTLGWSHYGTKAVEYLFGATGSRIYKVVFVCMTVRYHETGSCVGPLRYLQRPDDDPEPHRCAGPVRHRGGHYQKLL